MTKLEKFISKIILLSSTAFPRIVSEKMVVAIIFLLCKLNAFLNRLRKLFKGGNYSRKYGNLLTERFSIFEIKFRSYRSLCYSTAEHILRVSWAGGKMRSFTTFADYTLSQSHIDCRHHTQSWKIKYCSLFFSQVVTKFPKFDFLCDEILDLIYYYSF